MLNKIRLKNGWEDFKATFNWEDYDIPSWVFDANLFLWNYILGLAKKWSLDIVRVEDGRNESIEKVTVDNVKEEPVVTESPKEEIKEDKKEKKTKKK